MIPLSEPRKQAIKRDKQRVCDVVVTCVFLPILLFLILYSCFQFTDMKSTADKAKSEWAQNIKGVK
jgi:hypothetical protein